jgi:hypothetical protein
MRLDANTLEIAKHNRVEQAFMPAATLLKKSASDGMRRLVSRNEL